LSKKPLPPQGAEGQTSISLQWHCDSEIDYDWVEGFSP